MAAMNGGNGAARKERYIEAKTSVWWDLESCPVPETCDPRTIVQNIKSALVNLNYRGPVSISAYGDTTNIPPAVQQALDSADITLIHFPAGAKDARDMKILFDMLFWKIENPAPANYLLISGDRGFSGVLHRLLSSGYNILVAQPDKGSMRLFYSSNTTWLWTTLVSGGAPLTKDEVDQLAKDCSDYVSMPDSGNQDVPDMGRGTQGRNIGVLILMGLAAGILFVAEHVTNGQRPKGSSRSR